MNVVTIANLQLNPVIAVAVFGATVVTDAVYVFFTAAVAARHRFRAANWSSVWYLLSAFAVINYTGNPVYVVFAALGSWVGAFLSVSWLNRGEPGVAPVRSGPP
ncbi:MAG TPA: hypothetical protein VMF32_23405 [Xanthobacteraceae bacterium]|jgi:uncharacterized membrane protein YhaH (DUF805 family)|nr:hypothetical protein [Xanthobacteraceae bacterium]